MYLEKSTFLCESTGSVALIFTIICSLKVDRQSCSAHSSCAWKSFKLSYCYYYFIVQHLQSVSWILAEFYFNRGLQRLYTGTCIILQKTINGFLCPLIVFLKSKTYQLILKDVIKLNRNLR